MGPFRRYWEFNTRRLVAARWTRRSHARHRASMPLRARSGRSPCALSRTIEIMVDLSLSGHDIKTLSDFKGRDSAALFTRAHHRVGTAGGRRASVGPRVGSIASHRTGPGRRRAKGYPSWGRPRGAKDTSRGKPKGERKASVQAHPDQAYERYRLERPSRRRRARSD